MPEPIPEVQYLSTKLEYNISVRRTLPLILINIVVSAVVVLTVLSWWENREVQESAEVRPTPTKIKILPTAVATQFIEIEAEKAEERVVQQAFVPEYQPVTYLVQPGDTLGTISSRFDVAMDDIMVANGLDNPDFIQVNQQLIIPVDGLEMLTPEPSPTPTAVLFPTPISTSEPLEGEVLIEIGDVVGFGDLAVESISIVNNGSRPLTLEGWQLLDGDGNVYTFGQVTLFGEGAGVNVHSGAGQDDPGNLYWGMQAAVWLPGEEATLADSEGTVRATESVVGQDG